MQFLWKVRLAAALTFAVLPATAYAIVGGTPAPPFSRLDSATVVLFWNEARCSATVVGRRVLLTAAHCIQSSGEGRISLGGAPIRLTCAKHPEYDTDSSADFGLCGTDDDIPIRTIARINVDPGRLTIGKRVTLAGYGCGDPTGGGKIGVFRQGDAVITALPSARQSSSSRSHERLYTLTRGAASCFGDAGGGLFEPPNEDQSRPLLYGVQSRSDVSQLSYVSTVSTPTFLDWAKIWSAGNQQPICGIEADDAACEMTQLLGRATVEPSHTMTQPASTGDTPRRLLTGVIYKAGDTVQDIVARVCGPQEPAYYDLLAKHHEETTSWILTASTRFASAGAIDLPACSKSGTPQIKSVKVKQGDTPLELFKREADRSQWKTFATAGAPSPDSNSFVDAYKALNPALNINTPLKAGTVVSVPPVPLSPEKLPVTTAGLQPKEPQAEVAKTDDELQSGQECKGSDSIGYPYDVATLLDVLASNRKSAGFPASVTVLVADNGIFLSKHGGFNENILAPTEEEKSDDNFAAYREGIIPIQTGSKQSHGTQVASLVLGGPLLARLQGLTAIQNRIKIRPVSIYHETLYAGPNVETGKEDIIKKYIVKPTAFDTIVNEAFNNASIVNFSLKYYQDMPDIKRAITERGLALFVVAAGNEDGQLADKQVYPAMYGGEIRDGASNLIAVAALDGDRGIASISNYGPQWVEIGAPGCAIPVLSYNRERKSWAVEKLHGTSLAAPIVSFAAALIKSESRSSTAALIKRRLLVSADLNPALATKITDGRMLNVPKALSLWHDVVETNVLIRGKARLKQGSQFKAEDSQIEFDCKGVPVSVQPRRILKLVPNFRNTENELRLKIYYKVDGTTARFENAECRMPPDLSISIKDLELEEERDYPLDQVKDYVRRAYSAPATK